MQNEIGIEKVKFSRSGRHRPIHVQSYTGTEVDKLLWLGLGPMGGGHLYFRLDIILVEGLSKHTLNTYFSGMKIDPKYAFLHAFSFMNLSVIMVMSFPKFVTMTKNTPFFFF